MHKKVLQYSIERSEFFIRIIRVLATRERSYRNWNFIKAGLELAFTAVGSLKDSNTGIKVRSRHCFKVPERTEAFREDGSSSI